jgi:hypothetical protein
MPVVTPQPSRQTLSSGASLGSSPARFPAARCIRRRSRCPCSDRSAGPSLLKRLLPSGIRPLPWVARIAWQRLVLPDLQNLHSPHSAVYSGITWSPTATRSHAFADGLDDAAALVAEDGGKIPSGSAPDRVKASVWQTPVATMRTSTSPRRWLRRESSAPAPRHSEFVSLHRQSRRRHPRNWRAAFRSIAGKRRARRHACRSPRWMLAAAAAPKPSRRLPVASNVPPRAPGESPAKRSADKRSSPWRVGCRNPRATETSLRIDGCAGRQGQK